MTPPWMDMASDAGARGDEQRQMAAQIEEEERRKQEERLLHEHDLCPMGCGQTTEDPYGGPCERCWQAAP
jgi:hypothetical protein